MMKAIKHNAGMTIMGILFVIAIILVGVTFVLPGDNVPGSAQAGTATTSVTVLNTPPNWATGGDAEEAAESSAANPTNVGVAVGWTGTATDPNAESYFLVICKDSTAPTPHAGSAPTCNGTGQWAVSALTSSDTAATASYTAIAGNPETNDWYAFICDQNAFNPKCNATYKQGTGSTVSPFIVNHRPLFTVYADDSAKLPGELVTWTTTASDSDSVGGNDQVTLFVCKSNDFDGTACGAGGTYCTNGPVASNPTCNFSLESVKQDKNYTAYGYVIDTHNFAASGGSHGTDSVITVSNATPTISAASVSLLDTDEAGGLALMTESGQTTGFKVKFTVEDNNSCLNASSGNEIASSIINVYRSGVTQASCQIGGDYDATKCYPAAVGGATWNISCSQDGGSCSGASDPDATWTCLFPLWFVADPTDGASATDTQYYDQNWLASVQVTDDNSAVSSLVEGSTGNEALSFLGYALNTATIPYGSLEPGQRTDPIAATTNVSATGNVGLDETLYSSNMCTAYPTCPGNPQDTVGPANQRYAASSVAFDSATQAVANPGAEFEINVPKSTNTGAPASSNTFWGIEIPSAITLAGDYTGLNGIIGITGEAQSW
jgi:hypothetical protein